MRKFFSLVVLAASPLIAQNPGHDFRVVLPKGPGAISVHISDGWRFQEIHLYEDGPRPSLYIVNDQSKLGASYILFANDTKGPTSEACSKVIVEPVLAGVRKRNWDLKNIKESTYTTANGSKLLVTSYLVDQAEGHPVHQQNVFAIIGDQNNCAELHLSKTLYQPADDKLFNAVLDHFAYSATIAPTPQDYGSMATTFFREGHDPKSAAVYYQSALDTYDDAPIAGFNGETMRRVLTDQLSMSYGMSGDLKRSRAVNEAAILKDPTYPLYYYNLACADAESGDATAARTHLQQASDRRANGLKGEPLPDPTKDDSILKLKKNKDFWSFVESLPKS